MAVAFVTVKRVGRVLNAMSRRANVKCPVVLVTDAASKVNATVSADGRDHFANNVSVCIFLRARAYLLDYTFKNLSHAADCIDSSCSGHGTCVSGQCYCKAGWQGDDCGTVDQQVYQCLPGCSEHGTYDLETGTCVCERHWTGPDCSQGK